MPNTSSHFGSPEKPNYGAFGQRFSTAVVVFSDEGIYTGVKYAILSEKGIRNSFAVALRRRNLSYK